MTVPREFALVLRNAFIIPHRPVMIQTIRDAIEPLVTRAGRVLEILSTATESADPESDVTLIYELGGWESRPCGVLILGVEGGGEIYLGAHRDLRICSGPRRRGSRETLDIDYTSQLERIFDPGEELLARAIGNTSVHELGHMIASLDHTADPGNFMYSVPGIGGGLPHERRTRDALRRHWAGPRTFTSEQQDQLVAHITSGEYAGGMRVVSPP